MLLDACFLSQATDSAYKIIQCDPEPGCSTCHIVTSISKLPSKMFHRDLLPLPLRRSIQRPRFIDQNPILVSMSGSDGATRKRKQRECALKKAKRSRTNSKRCRTNGSELSQHIDSSFSHEEVRAESLRNVFQFRARPSVQSTLSTAVRKEMSELRQQIRSDLENTFEPWTLEPTLFALHAVTGLQKKIASFLLHLRRKNSSACCVSGCTDQATIRSTFWYVGHVRTS